MLDKNQRGISLIITFFIMLIILAVVLSVSSLLYSQLKVIKGIGESVISFYAAESGVEKVLYYDRKVLPEGSERSERGLCTMYSFDQETNPNACGSNNPNDSMNCINTRSPLALDNDGQGCNVDNCTNCQIYFETKFGDANYYITGTVVPNEDGISFDTEIRSKGAYGQAERQILIKSNRNPSD